MKRYVSKQDRALREARYALRKAQRALREAALKEDFEDWQAIPSFEDMQDFGAGTRWVPASNCKFFDQYTSRGGVFYGKGEGKNRQLKCVFPNGRVEGPFDVNDMSIQEGYDSDNDDEYWSHVRDGVFYPSKQSGSKEDFTSEWEYAAKRRREDSRDDGSEYYSGEWRSRR